MSTQFRAEMTDEWVGTRFYGGSDRGACFDFGANQSRTFDVVEAARSGARFVDEYGRVFSGAEFEAVVNACVWTYGEYGGTFEVGSGDMATFAGF